MTDRFRFGYAGRANKLQRMKPLFKLLRALGDLYSSPLLVVIPLIACGALR